MEGTANCAQKFSYFAAPNLEWHLGFYSAAYAPENRGFETHYGCMWIFSFLNRDFGPCFHIHIFSQIIQATKSTGTTLLRVGNVATTRPLISIMPQTPGAWLSLFVFIVRRQWNTSRCPLTGPYLFCQLHTDYECHQRLFHDAIYCCRQVCDRTA